MLTQVPDLTDIGYRTDANGQVVYQGWRKATIWVSPELLQAGVNQLQFTISGEESGSKIPLAIKLVKWQLKYAESTAANSEQVASAALQ